MVHFFLFIYQLVKSAIFKISKIRRKIYEIVYLHIFFFKVSKNGLKMLFMGIFIVYVYV